MGDKKTMKSLLIAVDFPPVVSGIGTVFFNVWKKLPEEKFIILAPKSADYSKIDKKEKYTVYRIKLSLGNGIISRFIRTISLIVNVDKIIKKENIDLLICGSPVSAGITGLIFKKFHKIPYIVFGYGGETSYYSKNLSISNIMKSVLRNADLIITNSNYTKKEFQSLCPENSRIDILMPGVDTNIFKPENKDERLIKIHYLKNKKVLLTVSRLVKRKGHDYVLTALAEIIKTYPNIVYIICGKGPEKENLKKIVKNLKLEDNVILAGYISDEELPKYYNLCDIYIMVNREIKGDWKTEPVEGFGISFIEASACAKPVIAGKSGGTEDAVVHEETGLLVKPDNEQEIKDAILRLINDENYAVEMGRRGRERVEKEFNWDFVAERTRRIIERTYENRN